MNEEQEPVITCSFCEKDNKQAAFMINAELANICDECIERCNGIIFQIVRAKK